jgi:hypothetical protein
MQLKKNTEYTLMFSLISSGDGETPITSGSPDGYVANASSSGVSTNAAANVGNGQWKVTLTAGELNYDAVDILIVLAGAISVHYHIETVTKLVSELNDLAAGAEMDLTDAVIAEVRSGLATGVNVTDARDHIESHGDGNWLTATGFATPANVTDAKDDIVSAGAAWVTATGFAAPTDVADAVTAIEGYGDTNWSTAVVPSVEDIDEELSDVHGEGLWTGSGSVPTADEVADAVWDEDPSEHNDVDEAGGYLTRIKAKTSTIGSLTVTYQSPTVEDDEFEIYAGDDYREADGRGISATIEGYSGPDLTDATAVLRLTPVADYDAGESSASKEVSATLSIDGTTVTVSADMTAEDTSELNTHPPDYSRNYVFQFIAATADGSPRIVTLAVGKCSVKQKIGAESS